VRNPRLFDVSLSILFETFKKCVSKCVLTGNSHNVLDVFRQTRAESTYTFVWKTYGTLSTVLALALALFSNSKKKTARERLRFGSCESERERAGLLVVKIMSEELDAELQRQIEIWQRDEAENEPARLEAEAREARELDEFLKRLLNAPSDF
jgi:hypothetical protein